MRHFFVFIIAISIAYYVVIERDGAFLTHGAKIMGFFSQEESRFAGVEGGILAQALVLPLVKENRELATEFQPLLKPTASRLAIPTAHASVIMDVDSGEVLYAANADQERQIASLTKLFTATIVMDRIPDLDALVTIDEEAVYAPGTRIGCPRSGFCTGIRLKVGEQVAARDLLKAALMNSANDAAIALAKHIGGSQEGFAQIMNERGEELGLEHSHFCTPSGLEPDGREHECYSSALDVARIASHAMKYPELWEMMRVEKTFISSHDGKYSHEIFNTDKLLGQLPNLIGTKTGFTPLAGYSLLAVSSDHSQNHKVVAVVLDDSSRWQSVQSMFDWSFTSFDWK